jgi:hypothetical protein
VVLYKYKLGGLTSFEIKIPCKSRQNASLIQTGQQKSTWAGFDSPENGLAGQNFTGIFFNCLNERNIIVKFNLQLDVLESLK